MRADSNATARPRVTAGVLLGSVAVLVFSLSLPATRVAVGALDPWFVAFGRAALAGVLALGYLLAVRARRPTRAQFGRLWLVVAGIVVGFPALTSLALVTSTSAHGAVVIACLPLSTAAFAVLRAGERPPGQFWLASGAGMAAVLIFVVVSGGVAGGLSAADLFLLVAVLLCGLGYAEGGALARELGGAQTICWALVISLPINAGVTAWVVAARGLSGGGTPEWLSFGYVTVGSMFLGFFAWYAGMARGGVARIGQVQLAQPVLTLGWSALLLGEAVGPLAVGAALVVLACVVWTQRARATGDAPNATIGTFNVPNPAFAPRPQAAPEPAASCGVRE